MFLLRVPRMFSTRNAPVSSRSISLLKRTWPSNGASRDPPACTTLLPSHPHGYLYLLHRPCNFADVKDVSRIPDCSSVHAVVDVVIDCAELPRDRRASRECELNMPYILDVREIFIGINFYEDTFLPGCLTVSPRSRACDPSYRGRSSSRSTNKFSHTSCKS